VARNAITFTLKGTKTNSSVIKQVNKENKQASNEAQSNIWSQAFQFALVQIKKAWRKLLIFFTGFVPIFRTKFHFHL
jgi:hypothetical protein